MSRFFRTIALSVVGLFLMLGITPASAQTTEFTYQGSLNNGASPANGNYDIELDVFDAAVGGNYFNTITTTNVPVVSGIFSVKLDLGSNIFPGAPRFLQVKVRQSGGSVWTVLNPRQQVTSVPYAVQSLNSAKLGGTAASQFVQTNDPRLTDARNPLPGSASYIQNGSVAQPNANFNIGGNGVVGGSLSALILSVTGGVTAQSIDVSSSVGYRIGGNNALSMSANGSTSVGNQAGFFNSGAGNSFFGQTAGRQSSTGASNSFFGAGAGYLNDSGNENSFFGYLSGNNSQGSRNSFVGYRAGLGNLGGNSNTLIGYSSSTGGILTNATALGANSQVDQSNSLVLGSINGVNGATSDTNVGIGTTTPANKLHVNGTIRVTNGGVYITNPNTVIITSPNGACWGITVNNSGGLATFPVNPCP